MFFAGIELCFCLFFGYYLYYDAIRIDQPTVRHLSCGLYGVSLSEHAFGIWLMHVLDQLLLTYRISG